MKKFILFYLIIDFDIVHSKTFKPILLFLWLFLLPYLSMAQPPDRIRLIEEHLNVLAAKVPGLNQKVQLMVSGVPVKEYLSALSRSNNLSISVDPSLNFTIHDTFNDITAANIIVFLAKKYNLDVGILGAIIYINPYQDPNQFIKPPAKDIIAKYNGLNNTLSLELDNDSLLSVVRKITQVSDKNVMVPTALYGKRVTAFINNANFDTAIEKLAFTNGLKMAKTSDGFYLLQPLGDNEELYVTGEKNTAVRQAFRPLTQEGGSTAGFYSRTVNGQKLISAQAVNTPIIDLLRQAAQELGKNYTLYSDIKGTISLHVNDVTFENFLNILFKGTEYTFQAENNVYLIGERRMEGLRTFKVIQLQHRSIDTVLAMIPNDWRRGMEIKEFREQNTLLLSGSSAHIAEVEAFIKQLDVLVPVVLIEVTLLDIRKTRTVSTGISAGISDTIKGGGTVFPGLNYTFSSKAINGFLKDLGKITSTNLGRVTPDFYLSLRALEANNNVEVRSVPKLSALNGHTASMSIGSSQYYKNVTQNVIPSATTSQSIFTNQFVETQANMAINIRPVVAGDDQVTLNIGIDISDFLSLPEDGSPPPKSTSKFQTSLRVNNEDMIVLGGIERTEKSESASGVPLLSRIPILKWLFSSRSKTNAKVVTVVFIKSTIIR